MENELPKRKTVRAMAEEIYIQRVAALHLTVSEESPPDDPAAVCDVERLRQIRYQAALAAAIFCENDKDGFMAKAKKSKK